MSGVPYIFGNATTSIPLSQLDVNFATNATLGNASVGLGNTTTTVGNLTVSNVTINGLSGGGANGVVYINSSNTATANASVLAFDGSNLGLGVTPSAWTSAFKVVEIGSKGGALAGASGEVDVFNNAYNNGSNSIYGISSYATQFQMNNLGQFRWYTAPSGTAGNTISFTQAMTLDNSGNLLVGTTNTSNSAGVGLKYLYNFSGAYQLALVTPSSTSSTTSIGIYSTGASANRFYVDDGGTIHATSTSITAISDASLKTNIKPLETGLAEINKLQPRRFDWLDQTKNEGTNIAGFISQEVQEVLPDLTPAFKYNDTETKLGLKMGDMIPTMVKAIQELSAKVTALQETVTALQAKVGT